MTIGDIENLFYTAPGEWSTYTVFVFENEGDADSWMDDMLNGYENHDAEVYMTIHSDMRMTSYVKEEVCNRKVDQIFAIDRNKFVIVLGGNE